MPFDGSVVYSVVDELNNKLSNAKVDKIHQPDKDELIIGIRSFGENYKLLLTCSPVYPRLHLTDYSRPNPAVPPAFCMLLRKHLSGSRIIGITQPDYERIVKITFECVDELGYSNNKALIIEIMGRHSNIIFIDEESNKIIDCIKRVSFEISSVREILPGRTYSYPPSGGKSDITKSNPLIETAAAFIGKINSISNSIRASKFIMNYYNGISPIASQEIAQNAGIDPDTDLKAVDSDKLESLYLSFSEFMSTALSKQFKPNIILTDNQPIDFYCFDLNSYIKHDKHYYDSISKAIEHFYHEKDNKDRLKQKYGDIQKIISNRLDRCYKKLEKLNDELSQAQSSDIYKIYGDLITSNIHSIVKGQTSIRVLNYYSPENEYIEIELDNQRTPAANAQRYYKLYNKAKTALKLIDQQLEENNQEIQYLEAQLDNLDKCTEELEINEIRDELIEQSYINKRKTAKAKKVKASKPMHFISSTGIDIYVGKNNVQNDYLTLKFAVSNDTWLHTKDIPGSHVIIKANGNSIDDTTLAEAANLAAYYSKAKTATKVPVDYTAKRNVKKPNGAKPGMVIYENYKTLYIDPDENMLNQLKKE